MNIIEKLTIVSYIVRVKFIELLIKLSFQFNLTSYKSPLSKRAFFVIELYLFLGRIIGHMLNR
ncbi:hypothetical protein DYB97_17760 [Vibrio cholerae]|nr:hypothetical protein [Vibrio cholerae]